MEKLVAKNSVNTFSFNSMAEAVSFVQNERPNLTNIKSIESNIKVGLRGWEMKHGVQVPRMSAYGYKWTKEIVDDIPEAEDAVESESTSFVKEEPAGTTVKTPKPAKAKKAKKAKKQLFAKNFRQYQHDYLVQYDRENPPKNTLHLVLRNLKRIYQGCSDLVY